MNLSASQHLIRDSARRYFERTPALHDRSKMRQRWAQFCELGWLGGIIPEDRGGFGGSVEMALLSREFGGALAPEPWIEAAVVPIVFLANTIPTHGHTSLCQRVIAGEVVVVLALPQVQVKSRSNETAAPRISRAGGRLRLSGSVPYLFGLDFTDDLIVLADDRDVPSAFLVSTQTEGVNLISENSIDGRRVTTAKFEDVILGEDAGLAQSATLSAALDAARDAAVFAQAAQSVGILCRMFGMTQEFLQVRKQFGRVLAEFQALRHRLADMYAELEQAKAMLSVGARALDSGDPVNRSSFDIGLQSARDSSG